MKNFTLKPIAVFFLFGILLIGLSNCDKIKEALTLNSPFSTHFIINVSENDDLLFIDQKEIDLSSNQDFLDNKDKIEYFTINEVYYQVVAYEGEPGILGSGSLTFYNGSTQLGDGIIEEDIDFNALFISGDKTVVTITDETKNAIQTTLKEQMKVTVKVEGLVTAKPVYVDLELFLVVGAKVNP